MKRTHPGRPPIDERDDDPPRVHVTLSARQYDQAYTRAAREGVSVPELARRGLARVLADRDEE